MADKIDQAPTTPQPAKPSAPADKPLAIEQHGLNAGLVDPCRKCGGAGTQMIKSRINGLVQAGRKQIKCRHCVGTGDIPSYHVAAIKAMRRWGHGQIISKADFDAALAALRAIRIGGARGGPQQAPRATSTTATPAS